MSKYTETYAAFQKRFCSNLRKSLKEAGLTQRQQLLKGLDPRYIARIKKGEGNPTLTTIYNLCKVIGINPRELFE